MRKSNKPLAAPAGSAYDSLPEVRANRGLDLQLFVDSYVEKGVGVEAYFAAGGEGDNIRAKKYASDLLKKFEVQQAITERSAQMFFELAPTAARVLKELLTDPNGDPKVRSKIALELMSKVQVDKQQPKKSSSSGKASEQFNEFMGEFREFARKNPEWQSLGRGNGVVIDADVELPALEEHEPA